MNKFYPVPFHVAHASFSVIILIYICHMYLQRMVDEEELQFHEEYMNETDPSILHFLLASGDDV